MTDPFKDLRKSVDGRLASETAPVEVISTGLDKVDAMFGVGGIPIGRLTEFFGAESSGKTTLAKVICAHIHKEGGKVAWLDTEEVFDEKWAVQMGMDLDRTFLIDSGISGEEGYQNICKTLGKVDLIVVDSIAKMIPYEIIHRKREPGKDPRRGAAARMNALGLKDVTNGALIGEKKTPKLRESGTALIFTNHIMDQMDPYGPPVETGGGHELKHDASIRVYFTFIGKDKDHDQADGPGRVKIRLVTKKNKLAPPFRQAEIYLDFDGRVGELISVVEKAVAAGLVKINPSGWITSDYLPKKMRKKAFEIFLASDTGEELRDLIKKGGE